MATQRIVICPNIYLCVVVKELFRIRPLELFRFLGFLPANLTALVVGVTGFEPVTLRLSSACSNQLSYTPN